MHRSWMIAAAFVAITCVALGQDASAQGLKVFFHRIAADTYRNNSWPACFVPQDRAAVKTPLELMVHNGWMGQNLISEQHFLPDTATLNQAGKLKVEWILTEAPSLRRTIYVRQTNDSAETQKRVDAVRTWASQVVGSEKLVDIQTVRMTPPGWPAEIVDSLERKYMETIPAPRLPERKTEGGNSSSSGQ